VISDPASAIDGGQAVHGAPLTHGHQRGQWKRPACTGARLALPTGSRGWCRGGNWWNDGGHHEGGHDAHP